MAKKLYKNIGSVVKGKDGKPDYIKISQDVVLKQGQFVNLESPAAKKASVEKALAEGKLDPAKAAQALETIAKIPAFVRFNLVLVEEQ